jgi:hypothetical protein
LRCDEFIVPFRNLQELIVRWDCGIDYDNIGLLKIDSVVTAEMEFDIGEFSELSNRVT